MIEYVTMAAIISVPVIFFFGQVALLRLMHRLTEEIQSVHDAVNSNLSEAQEKLNRALVTIETLERAIRDEQSRIQD